MKEILFLTMEDSAPGFALTGVRQQTLNQDEAWAAIQQACADQEVGVVAADTRLLAPRPLSRACPRARPENDSLSTRSATRR